MYETEIIPLCSWFCWRTLGGSYLFWALRSGPFLWTPPLFSLFLVCNKAWGHQQAPWAANVNVLAINDCCSVILQNGILLHHSWQEWTLKTQSLSGWLRSWLRYKHFKRWSPDSDKCASMRQSLPVWNASWHSKLVSTITSLGNLHFSHVTKESFKKSCTEIHYFYLRETELSLFPKPNSGEERRGLKVILVACSMTLFIRV